jgi:hypothetical protein
MDKMNYMNAKLSTHYLLPLLLLTSLTACVGPFSVVPYVAAGGVAAYAARDKRQLDYKERYENRCFPHERNKRDPFFVAQWYEEKRNYVEAYEYYIIASWFKDPRAETRLTLLRAHMSEAQIRKAMDHVARYTDINVNSCFEKIYCPDCLIHVEEHIERMNR